MEKSITFEEIYDVEFTDGSRKKLNGHELLIQAVRDRDSTDSNSGRDIMKVIYYSPDKEANVGLVKAIATPEGRDSDGLPKLIKISD